MAEVTKEVIRKEISSMTSSTKHKTRGFGGSGSGYMQIYLRQLQDNPLRTKMLTSGTLSALQELLASMIARDHSKNGSFLTPRVPKMAIYGALISAPLGHILVTLLQRTFAGRTSTKSKIGQIVVSNLLVSPIQNSVYLTCMAVIAGARTRHQIYATVRAGILPVMKVSWCTSPLALLFAQKFLPPHAWVPFFNLIAFVIGTYVNSITKKKRMAAIKEKKLYDKEKKKQQQQHQQQHQHQSGETVTSTSREYYVRQK